MAYNQYGGNQYGNQYGGPPRGGYGGYGPGGFQGGNRGPPPGADPQLWQWFSTVDTDGSGSIAPNELQQALVNGDWTPFDLDTVKLLMTLFDTDRSGTVGFNEFQGLWKYIKDWQGVFRHFDTDRSGSIDGPELNNALRQFGYNLSPELLRLVQRKYNPQGSTGGPGGAGGITFDRFVRCCVVIKQLTEAFQKLDPYHTGSVTMNYDTFMQTVLQAP